MTNTVSALKSETARRNGSRSNGPISIAGKRRSSKNALTHGLTAAGHFVLTNESAAEFAALHNRCLREFPPETETDAQLVWDLAHTRWRLSRLASLEVALLDTRMDLQDQQQSPKEEVPVDQAARTALAWRAESDSSNALSLLNRYEARLQRIWSRSARALEQRQRHRKQSILRNEPTAA